jgi:pentatricopeptide repeat protein
MLDSDGNISQAKAISLGSTSTSLLALPMVFLVAAASLTLQLPPPVGSSSWSHWTRQAARAAPLCVASATSTPPLAVFVSNVAWEASLLELRSVFDGRFGPVDEAWLAPDPRGLNHAGWGKIVFAQSASAKASLAAGTPLTLHGREVSVGVRDPIKEKNRQRRAQQKERRGALRATLAPAPAAACGNDCSDAAPVRDSATPTKARTAGATSLTPDPDLSPIEAVPRLQAERAWRDLTGRAQPAARQRRSGAVSSSGARLARLKQARSRRCLADCLQALHPLQTHRELTVALSACRALNASQPAVEGVLLGSLRAGMAPNLVNYNAALAAYEKAGAWREAHGLLLRMRAAGTPPDRISFHTAIAACRKGTSHDAARTAVRLVRQMPHRPSTVACTVAMNACNRAALFRTALSVFERMQRVGSKADRTAFNAALAACAGRGLAGRARQLLAEMRAARVEPDTATFDSAVQAAAMSGELKWGFTLLDELEQRGLGSRPGAYPIYHSLLKACVAAGDAAQATRVQAAIDARPMLSALAPFASATLPTGQLVTYLNGGLPAEPAAAARRLCVRAARRSEYAPQLHALPVAFLRNSTTSQQVNSLRHHAEKKALGDLIARGGQRLDIRINFKCCADCHELFKGASQLQGRPILLREPTLVHTFQDGRCSCADRWRWEARKWKRAPVTEGFPCF